MADTAVLSGPTAVPPNTLRTYTLTVNVDDPATFAGTWTLQAKRESIGLFFPVGGAYTADIHAKSDSTNPINWTPAVGGFTFTWDVQFDAKETIRIFGPNFGPSNELIVRVVTEATDVEVPGRARAVGVPETSHDVEVPDTETTVGVAPSEAEVDVPNRSKNVGVPRDG